VKQALSPAVISDQIKELSKCGDSGLLAPVEFIFGLRVYFGHLSVVAALEAQADWNQQVAGIIA
jgi:hypothetical protein